MNLQATLETLDEELRERRVKGMNGSAAERAKFLKACAHAARFTMGFALLATPVLRPGKTEREVFEEIVPKMIEKVAEQARNSGYSEEQVRAYVDAHERAYRALAGEFGFVEMSQDEIESLMKF